MKKKFAKFYDINLDKIDDILKKYMQLNELKGVSFSDYESSIVLSAVGRKEFKSLTVANNEDLHYIMTEHSTLYSIENFLEITFTTEKHIYITKYISMKRDYVLYLYFDKSKTNQALADKCILKLVEELKSFFLT